MNKVSKYLLVSVLSILSTSLTNGFINYAIADTAKPSNKSSDSIKPLKKSSVALPKKDEISKLVFPKIEYKGFTLKNGLRVFFIERHQAPMFNLTLVYNVGSRDEVVGKTGYAHLFEHMMFQGSENVGKAEHFYQINANGGEMNATTNVDYTTYYNILPSNQLEMALFLESDRMRSLDISQENLDNQVKAVQEERRLRYDNAPYGTLWEKMMDLTYDNFAYKHSTIGKMEDLSVASIDDIKSFFKKYYAPNNAVMVIVGDVFPEKAMPLIEKYFGNIPSQQVVATPNLEELRDKGERRLVAYDKKAPQPLIQLTYPSVPKYSKDFYAIDLMSSILAGNESSRLFQLLVKEKQLATDVSAGIWALKGTSPVEIQAVAKTGVDINIIESEIAKEIQAIQKNGVTKDELSRAKLKETKNLIETFKTSRLAKSFAYVVTDTNNPEMINTIFDNYQKVTEKDIQDVASLYLKKTNLSTTIILPETAVDKSLEQPQKK